MAVKPKGRAVVARILDGDEVSLSTDWSWTVRYDPVAKRIKFKAGNLDVMSIDAAGTLRTRGIVLSSQKSV